MKNIKRNAIHIATVIVLVGMSLFVASLMKELHATRARVEQDFKTIDSLENTNGELQKQTQEMDKQLKELHQKLEELKQQQSSSEEDIQSLKDKFSFVPENMKIDKKIRTVVTAYTVDEGGKKPTDKAYGITATGTKATVGVTVAVDPRIIPLGSYIYIPQFASHPNKGIFKAEDTGVPGLFGVDVLVHNTDAAYQIGRSVKEVYVLK